MLDPQGKPLNCETLLRYEKDKQEPALIGLQNRHGLCHGILTGDSRFDNAAGLMITRFHQ